MCMCVFGRGGGSLWDGVTCKEGWGWRGLLIPSGLPRVGWVGGDWGWGLDGGLLDMIIYKF